MRRLVSTLFASALTWTLAPELQLLGSWSRTLRGRNVVIGDLVTFGIGTAS